MKTRAVPNRWPEAEYAILAELADQESEGNISQQIRKLVREALAARGIRAVHDVAAKPERAGA